MIKTLFQLFFAFAKIGFTSFGGTSMIPLIMEEMLSHNWMTADDVANIVAIAEMTPGSLGVNCATLPVPRPPECWAVRQPSLVC